MEAPAQTTARVAVMRVPGGEASDVVAVEEPLELRISGTPVAVTMRTPGHDEELALGFAAARRPASTPATGACGRGGSTRTSNGRVELSCRSTARS